MSRATGKDWRNTSTEFYKAALMGELVIMTQTLRKKS